MQLYMRLHGDTEKGSYISIPNFIFPLSPLKNPVFSILCGFCGFDVYALLLIKLLLILILLVLNLKKGCNNGDIIANKSTLLNTLEGVLR